MWTGSIFNCTSGEITLRHHQFGSGSNSGAAGECNDGAVTAHSVGVVSANNTDCYISQLNVTSTTHFTDINNKTVTCLHVIDTCETVVDTRKYMFITGSNNNNTFIDLYNKKLMHIMLYLYYGHCTRNLSLKTSRSQGYSPRERQGRI